MKATTTYSMTSKLTKNRLSRRLVPFAFFCAWMQGNLSIAGDLPSESLLPGYLNRTLPEPTASNRAIALPSESTLPQSALASGASGAGLMGSKAKKAVPVANPSNESQLASSTSDSLPAGVPPSERFTREGTRTLPRESELPKAVRTMFLATQEIANEPPKTKDDQASSPPLDAQAETPTKAKDASDRGLVEESLFKQEGETTPWPRIIQDGHISTIKTISFSPDGKFLYSAGLDKLIHVWALDDQNQWTHRDVARWQVGRGREGAINSILASEQFLFVGGYGIKAEREIGVFDRKTLQTLSPLLDTTDLDVPTSTDSLADASSAGNAVVLATDLRGGLVRWELDQTGLWISKRMRARSEAPQTRSPVVAVPGGNVIIPSVSGPLAKKPWELELRNTLNGKVVERLSHQLAPATRDSVFAAMFETMEKSLNQKLSVAEKESHSKNFLNFSDQSCTQLAVSPGGKFVVALDNGWLVGWQIGKGLTLKFRQFEKMQDLPRFEFVSLAWSEQDSAFFVAEVDKKLKTSRIQKWTLGANNAWRATQTSEELDKKVLTMTVRGGWLAHDSGPQLIVRKSSDLSLVANLGRNAFYAPKRVQWASGGSLAWRWTDLTNTQHAIGIVTNERSEKRLQLIDGAKEQWLVEPTLAGGSLPKIDGDGSLAMVLPKVGRVTLEMDLKTGETIVGRYGDLTAAAWILNDQGEPTGVATSFSNASHIRVHGFPEVRENVCPLRRVFRGHEDAINAMQCSQDGRFLISSGQDRRICVWPLLGWDAAAKQDFDPLARWGLRSSVKENGIEIENVASDGPLYSRGLRIGDRIVKLAWTELDAGSGKWISNSSEAPEEILRRLQSPLSFFTSYAFWYQRGGEDLPNPPGFRRICQWEPLLTMTMNTQREWAAWAPLGFYDASINGDRLFGWQLNRGPDVRPEFVPADRFRLALERPDVIGNLLETGNIAKAFENVAVQIPGGPDGMLTRLLALQPTVEIVSPTPFEPIQGNRSRLRAKVRVVNGQVVVAPRAFVNGVVASNVRDVGNSSGDLDPSDSTKRIFTYEWDAVLPSDRKLKFQVYASTRERHIGVGEILLDRGSDASKSPIKPNVYVLAAGVSDYRDPSLTLSKASWNANQVAEVLTNNSMRQTSSSASVLTDSMVTPAAWRSSVQLMSERLAGRVSADDLVLIYLTGHGVIDQESKEYHFVTSRASMRDVMASRYEDCVSLSDLSSLKKVACKKLVILDTCHSGAAQQLDPSKLKYAVRNLQDDKMFVMTASEGNQLAFEGAFTQPLIDALRGKADVDKDRLVSLQEAFEYIRSSMQSQSGSQFPTLGPTDLMDVDFPIVRSDVAAKLTGYRTEPSFHVASPAPFFPRIEASIGHRPHTPR